MKTLRNETKTLEAKISEEKESTMTRGKTKSKIQNKTTLDTNESKRRTRNREVIYLENEH